jgi:beta-galactosidase
MIRIAAGGKEFWRAEAVGNSDWQERGGHSRPIVEKEVMADPANIRLDVMMSLAAGSRGFINPRWRALQDGPLFDAFGWYNLDGSRSERSEEIRGLARWANDPRLLPLWKAQPVRGQVGLLLLEESEIFCYSFYQSTDYYSLAYQGAYEAFLDAGIQADPIRLGHIDDYRILYLPFPVSLSDEAVAKLTAWVEKGGVLAAEGCFGYFSADAHAFEKQPSRGIDKLAGVLQDRVSFGPDLWEGLEFSSHWGRSGGGVFRQSYLPTTAKAVAWYDDGRIAAVENQYGQGKVRLIGTMAGYGYKLSGDRRNLVLESGSGKAEYLRLFASLLPFAGQAPLIRGDYNTGLISRLWASGEGAFLWCVNPRPYDQEAVLELNGQFLRPVTAEALRGEEAAAIADGRYLRFPVKARDAAVYKLYHNDTIENSK